MLLQYESARRGCSPIRLCLGARSKLWVVATVLVTVTATMVSVPAPKARADASTAAGQWFVDRGRLADNIEIAPGATSTVQVAGKAWMPSADVAAVALNVGAKGTAASGTLTIRSTDEPESTVTALSYNSTSYVQNLVMTKVGADGKISVANNGTGAVRVYLDSHGYTVAKAGVNTVTTPSTYVPLAPAEIVKDVTIPTNGNYELEPYGKGGIPTSGVRAVAVMVSATSTGSGTIRVYAAGEFFPADATIVYNANRTYQNFDIAEPGTNGKVNIHNLGLNPVTVSVKAVGYFATTLDQARYAPVTPRILLNTLNGTGIDDNLVQPLAPGESTTVDVTSAEEDDTEQPVAANLAVEVRQPAATGTLSIRTSGTTGGQFSSISFVQGQNQSGFDIVAPNEEDGRVTITNQSSGTVDVQLAVSGYFVVKAFTGKESNAPNPVQNCLDEAAQSIEGDFACIGSMLSYKVATASEASAGNTTSEQWVMRDTADPNAAEFPIPTDPQTLDEGTVEEEDPTYQMAQAQAATGGTVNATSSLGEYDSWCETKDTCTRKISKYIAELKANGWYGKVNKDGMTVEGLFDVVWRQNFSGRYSRYRLLLIWDMGGSVDSEYWRAKVRENSWGTDPTHGTATFHPATVSSANWWAWDPSATGLKRVSFGTPSGGTYHDDLYGYFYAGGKRRGTAAMHLPNFKVSSGGSAYYPS